MSQAAEICTHGPNLNDRVPADVEGVEICVDHGCNSVKDVTDISQRANTIPLSGRSSAPNLTSYLYTSHDKQDKVQRGDQGPGIEASNGLESQSSPTDKEDFISSRIPRVIAPKQTVSTSAAKENRGGSSIPIAIYRRSTEQLGAFIQKRQSEPSPSGLRLAERPRGPRPRPHTEQTAFTIPESAEELKPVKLSAPSSASSSSISAQDSQDVEELERPATVFTGEYRTRVLGIPGHHSPRPVLRIASSAENLIMGEATPESSTNTAAYKTSPSLRERLSKITPSTPKETESITGTTPGSRGTLGSKASAGSSRDGTPTSRKISRSQSSLDSISKRDISGKEMTISRKPVNNKPSLHSLFSPSLRSLRSVEKPTVPKIPDQYSSSQEHGVRLVSTFNPSTPSAIVSKKDTSYISRTGVTPIPRTAIKVGTMDLHPPRISSLQALSELAVEPVSEQKSAITVGLSPSVTTGLKRNVTFSDISPLTSENAQSNQDFGKPKLAESRSNHLLGSFRNIFRSRSGATDKERAKVEDNTSLSNEHQDSDGNNNTAKDNQFPNDFDKNLKPKPKHTRLSSGVSWTRGRNTKAVVESPTTPTPSIPRLLAPPHRLPDGNIPSFARPTRSTRTKASPSLKEQASVNADVNQRRTHVRTASTGSPQRLIRGSRRPTDSVLILSSEKRANQSPIPESEKTTATMELSVDSAPKNLDAFHSCLETLCRKVGAASTSSERDRHMRLALMLQQQLGDYQSIEKTALETRLLAREKLLEKKAAEENLNASLTEVQAHLED